MKYLTTRSLLAVVACGLLSAQAGAAPVSLPLNSGFDVSKPGTNGAIGGVMSGNFLKGVGEGGVTVQGGTTVTFDDSSVANPDDVIDLLGWNIVNGTAGGDLVNNGPSGSLAWNAFAAWSGGDYPRIGTDVLGQIEAGQSYTISVEVGGPGSGPISGPLAFHMLADGVMLTPDSQVDPSLFDGSFETMSRTYDAASLAGMVGQDVTIVVGVADDNTLGNRVIFDNVAITPTPIPEPGSLALLGLGGLLVARRRR